MKTMLRAVGLSVALALAGAGALRAQEEGGEQKPEDLFKSAREHYDGKKIGAALKDVQALQAAIAKMRVDQLKALMPDAPGDWETSEASGDAAAAMLLNVGVSVKREYRKGESSVNATLAADSPFATAMAGLLANPAIAQANPNLSTTTIQGKKAIVEVNKEQKTVKVTVLFNENTSLLTLEGNGVERKDVTETICKQFKFADIEAALRS